MLFYVWKYVPLALVVLGLVGVIVRPVMLKIVAKNRPLTERRKMWLWFGQALGFWAMVIGGWMIGEAILQEQLQAAEDEEEEAAEAAKAEAAKAKDEDPGDSARAKRKKRGDDDDEPDDDDD